MVRGREKIRVAYVDDDIHQLRILKMMMERRGELSVTSFSFAVQALKEIEHGGYDCVITDYSMPQIDGIELVKRIKEKTSLPVIMYSGFGDTEVVEAAFRAGADEFVEKTMDPEVFDRLAALVQSLVSKEAKDPGSNSSSRSITFPRA